MKQFFKMTLAVILGCLVAGAVISFIFLGSVGSVLSMGNAEPVMPRSAILKIDFSEFQLGEQTRTADPISIIQGNANSSLGILDAARAIEAAAIDPAVKYIYMKPDMVSGGMGQIEELRQAIKTFRQSGKAVISYIENPSNAGYYLATASDKIYMTPHPGGMNMLTGISSQMVFLKDILHKLGVNVQLIRHGKYKSAGEMFIKSESSPENRLQNEELISSIWESWSDEIAECRDITPEEFNEAINDLELNLPEDFLDHELVDGLLTKDELKKKLTEYFETTGFDQVAMISMTDYATLKVKTNYRAKNKVAVVFANGNVVDGVDNQQVAGDRFAQILSDVRKDDMVKAVVLRVNSPGGSVLAAEKIKNEVKLLAEEKPVIASFGDYAASGGYWISAGCQHIFTDKSTLTGSIGVFSMIPDFSGTLDDLIHVNVTAVNSNRHGDMYTCMRPLSDKEVAYMQAQVEDIYERFTGLVAEGRDLDVEYVDSIAQGRVWAGCDAVELKLADQVGTLMDAINYAVIASEETSDPSQWQIAEYPAPMSTMEMLMSALNGSTTEVFADTPFNMIGKTFKGWNASQTGKVYARIPYELNIR